MRKVTSKIDDVEREYGLAPGTLTELYRGDALYLPPLIETVTTSEEWKDACFQALNYAIEETKKPKPPPPERCQECGRSDVHMAWCPEVRHLYERKSGDLST